MPLCLAPSRNATVHPSDDTACNFKWRTTQTQKRTGRRADADSTRRKRNSPKSVISATQREEVGKVNAHSPQRVSHAKVKRNV